MDSSSQSSSSASLSSSHSLSSSVDVVVAAAADEVWVDEAGAVVVETASRDLNFDTTAVVAALEDFVEDASVEVSASLELDALEDEPEDEPLADIADLMLLSKRPLSADRGGSASDTAPRNSDTHTVRGRGVPEHDTAERGVLLLRFLGEGRELAGGDVAGAGRGRRAGRTDEDLHVLVRGLGLRPSVPGLEVVLGRLVKSAVVVVYVTGEDSTSARVTK